MNRPVPAEVNVLLTVDGKERRFEADGYFGWLKSGQRIDVLVDVPRGRHLFVFSTDGVGNISPRKPFSGNGEGDVYRLAMPVKDYNGKAVPARENRLKLLSFAGNGKYVVWDLGICAQDKNFFLIGLQTDEGTCYWEGEQVVCPDRSREWPQFEEYLGQVIIERGGYVLPSINLFKPAPDPKYPAIGAGEAVVEWFNPLNGFGAAKLHDGRSARVHWTQIISDDRLRALIPGQRVYYEKLKEAKQANERETSFKFELAGVRPA